MEALLTSLGLSNIHPAVVHFPIALLVIYSLLEFIPFQKIQEKLFLTKAILVLLGTVSVFIARQTGKVASVAYKNNDVFQVIQMHDLWSQISFVIFSLLSFSYALSLAKNWNKKLLKNSVFGFFHAIFTNPLLRVILALAGLVSISITGALGGAIAYGATNDPMVQFIYSLFFK